MASSLAMVCGATGGLGPAVVAEFAGRGDRVVAVSNNSAGFDELEHAHGHVVGSEVADLSDPESVEAMWVRLGEIPKWLVNLVGGWAGGTAVEATPESVQAQLDLNLMTAWWSCKSAIPR